MQRKGGVSHAQWRLEAFLAALFASLLVLVPLVGGTVLLSRQQLRAQLRQAARSESGVPIQLPKTTDQLTVLLCVSGEQPGFVLAYLNASQNCVHLLACLPLITVPFAEEETSLARCWPPLARPAAAKHWQVLACRRTQYLAFSPAVLERIASRYGPVRVGLYRRTDRGRACPLWPQPGRAGHFRRGRARILVASCRPNRLLLPLVRTAAARAAVWDAFFRQDLDLLPATPRMPCVPAVRPCSPT